MNGSVLSPAVLAICLDSRSLPHNARFPWQNHLPVSLPRSLADRLTWSADVSAGEPRSRSRSPMRSDNGARRFANSGVDIMEAHSSADALALLRILRFDLAVVGGDVLGTAVPALLKQIQIVSPGTRCIVVSSTMDERSERSVREAGVLAILDAPLPFDQLRDVVSHLAVGR
jgi:hypothetical protein